MTDAIGLRQIARLLLGVLMMGVGAAGLLGML